MHAQEIVNKYQAEPAEFVHRVVIINVNRSIGDASVYEATRYAWKINIKKASRAEYVVAVRIGMIVNVFNADQWLPATSEYFPGREPIPGRFGFIGKEAPTSIRKLYVGKRLPEEYRKKGAANPIKYSYQ